jgi:hypothetical protein
LIALIVTLGQGDIERAQQIARGSEAERARFHGQYFFMPGDATFTELEVTTEFRRAVLLTEDHLRRGDWLFSQSVRSAEQALQPTRGLVSFRARVRFNPLNAYVTVPPYMLGIGGDSATGRLLPIETQTTPQYSASFKSQAGTGTALLGAILTADLMAAALGQSARPVGVLLDGREIGRVTVDFRQLDRSP